MNRVLALLRTAALILATIGLSVFLGAGQLLLWARPDAASAWTDRIVQRWARFTQRLMGIRIVVDGERPRGPVALVMNHLSYMDIVVLWCVLPGVFVARADVAEWPLVGQAGKLIGTIFIDRTRKRDLLRVIPEMERALAAGRNVIFFPEGTSSRGEGVLEFKSSLFEAAARQGVPVVSASLEFETAPPAPTADWSVCWWGDMTFGPHAFSLLHQRGFEARIRFSSASHAGSDRKALCQSAEAAVREVFVPTTPPSAAAACERVLAESIEVVRGLTDEAYADLGGPEGTASPGAHVRHLVDYVVCLLQGIDASRVDYTARKRRGDLESSRRLAEIELLRCSEQVEALGRGDLSRRLRVRADSDEPFAESTLGRELSFVTGHAVHHLALVRLTLQGAGVVVPDHIGVSASTRAYRARERGADANRSGAALSLSDSPPAVGPSPIGRPPAAAPFSNGTSSSGDGSRDDDHTWHSIGDSR